MAEYHSPSSSRRTLLQCLTALWLCAAAVSAATLEAHRDGDRIDITIDGRLFTSYKFASSLKKPYLYPVNGPRSGVSVTIESHPSQYPHHNSLWLGCDRVNGGNYWQSDNARGQIVSTGPEIETAKGDAVVIRDVCQWRQPGQPPIMRETRTIRISVPGPDVRLLDFSFVLEPLTDITIEKTNHSLFSGRIRPALSVESGGTLVNAQGGTGAKGTFGVPSPWCDYYGTDKGVTEGMAILCHPDNPWYPSPWFTRDYGFFSPTPMYWPKGGATRLPKGKPVTLRYRVVVHAGDTRAADIAGLYRQYAPKAAAALQTKQKARLSTKLEGPFSELTSYDYGKSRAPLLAIEALVREAMGSADEVLRAELTKRLGGMVAGNAPYGARAFACRKLSLIGDASAVPVLADHLADPKLGEMARFALQRIPDPAAEAALLAALRKAAPDASLGLMASLAVRHSLAAVPALSQRASSANPEVVKGALDALGEVGGEAAATALAQAKVQPALQPRRELARLRCAEGLRAAGKTALAAEVFAELTEHSAARHVRLAALRGWLGVQPDRAVPRVLKLLEDPDPTVQRQAARLVGEAGGQVKLGRLAEALHSLSPPTQVVLITAFAERGDRSTAPAVVKAAGSDEPVVRLAAVQALATLGRRQDVPLLTELTTSTGEVGTAAQAALARMPGNDVEAAMIAYLPTAGAAGQPALIEALASRGCHAALPAILKAALAQDERARKAAVKAIRAVAQPADLAQVLSLLSSTTADTDRQAVTQAAITVAGRAQDADAVAALVVEAMAKAPAAARSSFLPVLGELGGTRALSALRNQLKAADSETRKAAVRTLSGWPDDAPADDLLMLAGNDPDAAVRVLALRGYIDIVAAASGRPAAEGAAMLQKALATAQRPDEKRLVLAALPAFPCDTAKALARSVSKDPALQQEAALALKKLERGPERKFDFQGKGNPVMAGWTAVDPSVTYDDRRGYGWTDAPADTRDRVSGTALTRDFVFDSAPRTFRVKVPNGPCLVTVYLGDTTTEHDAMEVYAEGAVGVKGISNRAGEVKTAEFGVDVKDGLLDITFKDGGGSNAHWTCPGITVR